MAAAATSDKMRESTPLNSPEVSEDGYGSAGAGREKTRRALFACSAASLCGPGMFCALADTDAPCLITAADSGARSGYSLVLLQLLLTAPLFITQELTVRLGVHTRKGHAACIREAYGAHWAFATTAVLLVNTSCATVSEMGGIAAVGELWGLSRVLSTLLTSTLLLSLVLLCSYRTIEILGCGGWPPLFELSHLLTPFRTFSHLLPRVSSGSSSASSSSASSSRCSPRRWTARSSGASWARCPATRATCSS